MPIHRFVLISAGLMLLANAAMAMPKVGDEAIYDVTYTQGAEIYQSTADRELLSYDSDTNTFDDHLTITQNGASQVQDETTDAQSLLTDGQVSDVLANCAYYEGKLETVTVPAGTFQACALPLNNDGRTGTAWEAQAAFGLIMQDYTQDDGSHIVMELHSQVFGQ